MFNNKSLIIIKSCFNKMIIHRLIKNKVWPALSLNLQSKYLQLNTEFL